MLCQQSQWRVFHDFVSSAAEEFSLKKFVKKSTFWNIRYKKNFRSEIRATPTFMQTVIRDYRDFTRKNLKSAPTLEQGSAPSLESGTWSEIWYGIMFKVILDPSGIDLLLPAFTNFITEFPNHVNAGTSKFYFVNADFAMFSEFFCIQCSKK